jgi:pullulanase
LLKIRNSSSLFRLDSAAAVMQRLRFPNSGAKQEPTVMVGHLDGKGLKGARFGELLYAINVGTQAAQLDLGELRGRKLVLHPVHRAAAAADKRVAKLARWDSATGKLNVPARTAVVWVGR